MAYSPGEQKEQVLEITTPDGNTQTLSMKEANLMGYNPSNLPDDRKLYTYTDENGERKYTTNYTELPASITLDEKTGDIKITAPSKVTEIPEFQKVFNTDELKKYSLAYKLNPDYKVVVKDYDEETGEEKGEREVTIPEWVENRNDALKKFMSSLNDAETIRGRLVNEYGDKVYNMSLSQIIMTQQYGKYTYIPEILKHVGTFGDNRVKNPIEKILGKISDDGTISAEDLKEFYNRDYFGRTELAGLLATINGALKGSDFGSTYYEDENGKQVYSEVSAEEAAKLIAFKNFVLSKHPDGNFFQEVGSDIETFSLSALYGADRVFFNFANDVEWVFSGGQGKNVQNYIKDMDKAMEYYVQTKSLESEATQTLYTLGMIAGTIAGTAMTHKLVKSTISDIGKVKNAALGAYLKGAAGIKKGTAAYEALSNYTMAQIVADSDNLTKGAWIAIKMASATEKAQLATNIYRTFMDSHKIIGTSIEFLMDTFHDALLYDSTTLRDALESTDEEVRNFWMGQFADNLKWWGGMAGVKGAFKIAGKTKLGKAINVVSTRLINKIAAKVGRTKTKVKDLINGGDTVAKLEKKLKEAISDGHTKTANRLQRKIEIENWNAQLRAARSALGDVKLEWDGLKLTDDSLKDYQNAVTRVKALELGIDRYRNSIEYKRQEMVGVQVDPSTGNATFINKNLGMANANASNYYFRLSDLAKKYNLTLAEHSMISQEMIDYWVSSYYERLAKSFAKNETVSGVNARQALPIIQKNAAEAAAKLPDEIVKAIDEGVQGKVFQLYYFEQNEYGMSKGLLNRTKFQSYQENPIWRENGYMPIVVALEDKGGRYIEAEGRLDAKIADEMEHLKFNVAEGQRYQDPELVRQSRLSGMAQMEVNSQMFTAYAGFGSDATHVIQVSGEETEYVRILNENRAAVSKSVSDSIKSIEEKMASSEFEITKVRRRRPIKNTTVPQADRVVIVNSLSPDDVNGFLVKQGKIEEGKTVVESVTVDNYADWYKNQTPAVKKFMNQQKSLYYADFEVDDRGVKVKRVKIGNTDDVPIDAMIADRISTINESGYTTFNSHSGISADHADGGDAGFGYIQFDANLEPEKIQKIKTAAEKAGMDIEESTDNPVWGKTLVVRQSKTVDGTSWRQIRDEANRAMDKKFKVPKAEIDAGNSASWIWENLDSKQFKAAYEYRDKQIEKLAKQHGGYAQADDTAISKSWDKFFNALGAKELKYNVSWDEFQTMAKSGGADFEDGLERAMLVGNKDFAKSTLMNEARHNLDMGREAFYQGILVAEVKGNLRNVKTVDTSKMVDEIIPEFDKLTNSYVKVVLDDEGVMQSIAALAENTEASAEFARYIALKQLKETGMDDAHKALDNAIDKKLDDADIDSRHDADLVKKEMRKLFDDTVETELDDLSQIVRTSNPDLVDTKDIYYKVKELDEKINSVTPKKVQGENTVMYLDNQGRQVFAEVDPAFASLFNYRFEMTKAEAIALAKVNAMTSRWFRYGTTTVNLKSFGNQLFRDFGNALVVGGAWQTIKSYRQNLVDVFGKNIVDQIGRFDPTGYEMKQVTALARDTGQTLEEAAVSRELMRGAANAPSTTEHTLYKKFMREAYGDTDGKLTRMKNKLTDFVNEHKMNPEYWLNDKRENYLRNRVFAASLNDALKQGYDLEQARIFADFAMNNATTNFSRQLYHMQAIADSTPYFRAAINGSKSFWRMWSLDPVGISGRITAGLVIPVMYLVGASLGSEENRRVYENIPEYQKQDSFVFVVRGQTISLPLPQELATFVAPYRQFVEYLHGTNHNDFWELMMNDVLGFFPYDLQGFSTIDMDKMIQDPTVFDRMSRGIARVFSKMAPVPLKTAYILATGTDPYTGKSLRNPEYSWWNEETHSVESFDYNQNEFAKAVASIPFIKDWVTPELAEKVISGVIGSTGSNVLGDITAIFTQGPGKALETTLKNATDSFTAPYTVPQYDLVDAIWKRAVKELTAEKNAILSSQDMQTISKELAQTKDPKKREELNAERRNLTNAFQQKVGTMVERLSKEYGGTYDAQKFAATIQLLNFNSDPIYQAGSQYSSDLATDMYYEGRDAAIQTMRALGIDGVHDTSIFGYLTQDKDGNVVMRYNSPVAIMEMEATWGNQKDYHLANIKALISENDLWDKKEAMDAKVDAIYAKDSLSSADYDKINEIYIDWNNEVMKVLAPYIEVMTPEAAINNTAVMDYLDGLIKVPSEFKKDKNGKYVTNKKLGAGSATDAYMKNYINYIFGINDTGYSSGRNYSDRKNYDKENKRWTK